MTSPYPRPPSRSVVAVLVRVVLVALLLAGCSGSSCGDLAGLTSERDAARSTYADLVAQGVQGDRLDEAHDAMHALDQQVAALKREC
jgi:hypothetical protein